MINLIKTFTRNFGLYNKKFVWKYKTLFGQIDTMTLNIDRDMYTEFVKRLDCLSVTLIMLNDDYIVRVTTIDKSKVLCLENKNKIIQAFINVGDNGVETIYVILNEKDKTYPNNEKGDFLNIHDTTDLLKSMNMIIEIL